MSKRNENSCRISTILGSRTVGSKTWPPQQRVYFNSVKEPYKGHLKTENWIQGRTVDENERVVLDNLASRGVRSGSLRISSFSSIPPVFHVPVSFSSIPYIPQRD